MRKSLASPIVVIAVVVLLWLLSRVASTAIWLVGLILLIGGTYWLLRPELRTFLGASSDHRPWLVRLREHRWRPVWLPGGYRVPRWAAYLAIAVAWRLLV